MKTDLILVGGFLGAGKTTLLNHAAQIFGAQGKKTGLIANDQTTGLVDAKFLHEKNDQVEELSGSCFCCNYNGFVNAIKQLEKNGVQLILAEPVGSCTDLSATILQPLKDKQGIDLNLLPLSVVADPDRLSAYLHGKETGLHPSAAYIFNKQLEEADIILINKLDQFGAENMKELTAAAKTSYPGKPVLGISAKTGAGLKEWIETIAKLKKSGQIITDVDYDIYAEGEAVLGWLNMEIYLKKQNYDWNKFARVLMNAMADSFAKTASRVAHVKILLTAGGSSIMANLTGTAETLAINGSSAKADDAKLIINARVETSPERLQEQVESTLICLCQSDGISFEMLTCNCLQPGRPNPTYRYNKVVELV